MLLTNVVVSNALPSFGFPKDAALVANPLFDPAETYDADSPTNPPEFISPAELGLLSIQQAVPNATVDLVEGWVYGLNLQTLTLQGGGTIDAYVPVDGPIDFWTNADYLKIPEALIENAGLTVGQITQIKQARALAKLSPEDRVLLGLPV